METPDSLSLPLKTRIVISVVSTATSAATRKDGTVNRRLANLFHLRVPPTSKPSDGVTTHDVVVDPARKLWFRVFVPIHVHHRLPVILFFHGGYFSYMAPDVNMYDAVCRRFARNTPAVVVSVDYRLAPEHRYPAQHDDCFDVLKFLDHQENRLKYLPENANTSCCFVAGDSAGGNLAHHVTQRASQFDFHQLKVVGLVAIQPFFGGEDRTDSEMKLQGAPLISLKRTDWHWNAFMPAAEGYDRDHPIINVSGPNAIDISSMDFPPTMVFVAGFDPLRDWQKRYYDWLKKSGKEAYLLDYPNMFHAFYLFPELPESDQLLSQVKDFIHNVLRKTSSI